MDNRKRFFGKKEKRRFSMRNTRLMLELFDNKFERLDLCGEWQTDGTVRLYVGDDLLGMAYNFPFSTTFELDEDTIDDINRYVRANKSHQNRIDNFVESRVFECMPQGCEQLIIDFMRGL